MNLEICLIVLGIAILLLATLSIPILLGLWRTIKDITMTLETLNSSLPSILKNLEEITVNINSSTNAINREVQNISGTVSRFQLAMTDIVDDIQNIAPVVMNSPGYRSIKNAFAVYKGVRAFLNVILTKPSAEG